MPYPLGHMLTKETEWSAFLPLGLVYLLNKHLVDRYNIYFAYGPSRIDKDIHASAINMVMIAVMLLQFTIVFFTILRASKWISFLCSATIL